jgi:hypothetical protein
LLRSTGVLDDVIGPQCVIETRRPLNSVQHGTIGRSSAHLKPAGKNPHRSGNQNDADIRITLARRCDDRARDVADDGSPSADIRINGKRNSVFQSVSRPPQCEGTVSGRLIERVFGDRVMIRTKRRAAEVPRSIARLAEAARTAGVPLLSHDDTSPEQRRWFRSLGCQVAEFPTTLETAQEAIAAGDAVVLGAPNVVRGKSHIGWTNAATMVAEGLCSILASDYYYYPAPLIAAFKLAERAIVPLAQAWQLIADAPAQAMKLTDRGRIEPCSAMIALPDANCSSLKGLTSHRRNGSS